MYSGWSPFLRTKFWKKELVGRGEERSRGEKKGEGSGRTVDWAFGKRKGVGGYMGWRGILGGDGGGEREGGREAEGSGTGTGETGLGRRFFFFKVREIIWLESLLSLLPNFFNISGSFHVINKMNETVV